MEQITISTVFELPPTKIEPDELYKLLYGTGIERLAQLAASNPELYERFFEP